MAFLADDHTQFEFPVDVIGRHAGNPNRVARIVKRGQRRLHEDIGERRLSLGRLPAPFLDVLRVIPGQQQQFGRVGHGHLDLDRFGGDPQLGPLLFTGSRQRVLQRDRGSTTAATGQERGELGANGDVKPPRRGGGRACSDERSNVALYQPGNGSI